MMRKGRDRVVLVILFKLKNFKKVGSLFVVELSVTMVTISMDPVPQVPPPTCTTRI
jgi:hypothetical protein